MSAAPASLIATAVTTPFGVVSLLATADDGVVHASGFGQIAEIASRLPRSLTSAGWISGDHPAASDALEAWSSGVVDALATIPYSQDGGPFMQKAWEAIHQIPGGQVMSYGEVAIRAGSPRAMRAAGQACARNNLAPFVPCHRVVAASGIGEYGVGHYAYGVDLKREMLLHEGVDASFLR